MSEGIVKIRVPRQGLESGVGQQGGRHSDGSCPNVMGEGRGGEGHKNASLLGNWTAVDFGPNFVRMDPALF